MHPCVTTGCTCPELFDRSNTAIIIIIIIIINTAINEHIYIIIIINTAINEHIYSTVAQYSTIYSTHVHLIIIIIMCSSPAGGMLFGVSGLLLLIIS